MQFVVTEYLEYLIHVLCMVFWFLLNTRMSSMYTITDLPISLFIILFIMD
jgi:Cu/Ag efflux pump CusA